jgi:hypothetical protein
LNGIEFTGISVLVFQEKSVTAASAIPILNRVQFENHGPARLGPGNVPAVSCRSIKGVELRFSNWMRFSILNKSPPIGLLFRR